MIQLLIADDHALVRESLKRLFSATPDIVVAGEASSGDRVLELLRPGGFDLLLLDVSMPGLSGEELMRRVHRRLPELPILVLSMYDDPRVVRRKLKAGAAGYLTKDSEPEVLLAAVRKVAAGGRFIGQALAERIAFEEPPEPAALQLERLSRRERQVLRLLVEGHSLRDIAARLTISHKTVSSHKARLMQKLEVDSDAELILLAFRNRI